MILRSRAISSQPRKEPLTPRNFAHCDCPVTPQTEDKGSKKVKIKSPKDVSMPTSTHSRSRNNRDSMEDEVSPPKRILRSCKIPHPLSMGLRSSRIRSECDCPQTQFVGKVKRVQPKSHRTELMTLCLKKRNPCLLHNSKNSMNAEGLQTPIKDRSVRVNFHLDDIVSEEPSFVGSILSPVISFLSSPVQDLVWGNPSNNCSKSPLSECPYFSPLPGEEPEAFKLSPFSCKNSAISFENKHKWKDIPLKTRSTPESTLVLDPENILVNSSLLPYADPDYTFVTCFQDTCYKVYLKLHPHGREFLEVLCKAYEIFVFTTAKKAYAEQILDILDPQKKLIRHRLFQDQCVCVGGHYVKDLRVIQRDLAKTVALDSNPHNFPLQKTNRIPVKNWTGSQTDDELMSLLPILKDMTLADDVRVVISHRFKTEDLRDEED